MTIKCRFGRENGGIKMKITIGVTMTYSLNEEQEENYTNMSEIEQEEFKDEIIARVESFFLNEIFDRYNTLDIAVDIS